MGDDNSRAAGYGLYKFRIPVSVLPGRETTRGHAAVVTLRAQLDVDEAHLRYAFPKLAIADAVESLTPLLIAQWDNPIHIKVLQELADLVQKTKVEAGISSSSGRVGDPTEPQSVLKDRLKLETKSLILTLDQKTTLSPGLDSLNQQLKQMQRALSQDIPVVVSPIASGNPNAMVPGTQEKFVNVTDLYGAESIDTLRYVLARFIESRYRTKQAPQPQEVREFLFAYFGQINNFLRQTKFLDTYSSLVLTAVQDTTRGHGSEVHCSHDEWIQALSENHVDAEIASTSWIVAFHAGILDHNLKKLLEELQVKRKLEPGKLEAAQASGMVFFASSFEHMPLAVELWQMIIRENFPLSVFTLDPQVEEQNVYDAFSRRREMQLALAYNVARGRFNTAQKLAFSRQLGLDQADIGLNRTVVGFSHGDDTFGWYFYPRVQCPPVESTNIGALARTIWSTGPTDHYDLRHRKLEPGIRECEVLVAMPSFVTEVRFDVTTNWECLTHPGVTKRSYEEMLAQGGRIHQLKMCLGNVGSTSCYRPEDVRGLFSRVDQLEKMLGLQTFEVNVPYEYEQSGTDLFDTGNAHLRPELTGYYGLDYLQPDEKDNKLTVYVFLTGRNFHPTLTHVIVGGVESHSLVDTAGGKPDVAVINRQLIRVKISGLNKNLSREAGFQVRVGTPAGVSNPVTIGMPPSPPAEKPKGWSFKQVPAVSGTLNDVCCPAGHPRFALTPAAGTVVIEHNLSGPLPPDMNGLFMAEVTGTKKDGSAITFKAGTRKSVTTTERIPLNCASQAPDRPELTVWIVDWQQLGSHIARLLNENLPDVRHEEFKITVTGYIAFDSWPIQKVAKAIEFTVQPCDCKCPTVAPEAMPIPIPSPIPQVPHFGDPRGELPAPAEPNAQRFMRQTKLELNGEIVGLPTTPAVADFIRPQTSWAK